MPQVEDDEVMSGVEDFQVQFGVDTDGNGAADGAVNMYVDPDNPVLAQPGMRVRSVRVWMLVRNESTKWVTRTKRIIAMPMWITRSISAPTCRRATGACS